MADAADPAAASRTGSTTRAVSALLLCSATVALAAWAVWGRGGGDPGWGAPVVSESFADGSWSARWDAEPDDGFQVRAQRLVSTAPLFAIARCRTVFAGPVALEFSGEITPGSSPCDLSVAWWDGVQEASGYGTPRDGWLIQAGAFDNSFCAIIRVRDGRQEQVARRPLRLETGRIYRIRGEIDGARLALRIDGREILAYEDALPVSSGQIGIYGYYPGKAFDDLVVYNKGLPARVSPLAIGDDHAEYGDWTRAATAYRRVLLGHRTGALADEAWYKLGCCQLRLGDATEAWRSWTRVAAAPWTDLVALQRLDRDFAAGDHDAVLHDLPAFAARSPACRSQAEGRWAIWSAKLGSDTALCDRYLALRQRLFPGDGPSVTACGRLLLALGRWEQALDECSGDPLTVSEALLHLGRGDEAEQRFGRMNWIVRSLREQTGDLQKLADDPAGSGRPYALAKLGHIAEARAAAGDEPPWQILAAAGDWAALRACGPEGDADALARIASDGLDAAAAGAWRNPPAPSQLALLLQGKVAEAEAADDRAGLDLPCLRLLASLAAGDAATAASLRTTIAATPVDWSAVNAWFGPCILVPFLAAADGDAAAWTKALDTATSVKRRAGQRLWHLASFLAGRCDAATVLAQPYAAEATAWLRLGEGIRAERAGDQAAARTAYRAFQDLPLAQRLLDGFHPDPRIERFVAWRLQQLR